MKKLLLGLLILFSLNSFSTNDELKSKLVNKNWIINSNHNQFTSYINFTNDGKYKCSYDFYEGEDKIITVNAQWNIDNNKLNLYFFELGQLFQMEITIVKINDNELVLSKNGDIVTYCIDNKLK